MTELVVADTSCLIVLDKTGRFDLLQKLYGNISITREVADEFGLELPNWINIVNPELNQAYTMLKTQLDIGEASSIALALDYPGSLLLIDERKGRKIATSLNINIIGTLGILIKANYDGLLNSLKDELSALQKAGFYIKEDLISAILKKHGKH